MSEQATQQTTQSPVPGPAPVAKPAPKGIVVADSAVARLKELLEQRQTPEAGLRLAVKGGGCSGLQYSMEWSEKSRERDKIFERDGVRVFVDPKSYLYLIGTELVFEQTLMASGFKLNNPNIKAACGCGESFSV
ncbi:iron-sulfur cluster assembly accessory protein [Myxococcus sp. CA051A]|uniref:Iron-sulfur cluster assembly accessory protein n=1 Tax=Myxococcus llanfairpwllgwyngyllgogerychwyrndrobwllllantysiliogogogochensis TaxID=2590453 RepID=A0A540WYH9_9BACT|nr:MULTISPECIES: iron-sulfur cluster assembly accessory protein [Myxococcus]NTX01313.1 iron-sulfur cluster assembly accessory protein [Myxococcus sp. CA040A]NTX15661.1 iron-sulfur cluster assembly accessory protein [Myxococcus sp. CA056]NTX32996.1 iron-sulfur cluster assembly accessory protein [Myxococcus sp. CA033]NTX53455.1 iron-sulfur cluster assembly accessory protein [Myxococcus sp. CA039A]NTX59940.1 iron-sulfur cluster assembly accessory protein [Myxococcus sp. CA051A]